jgi:purine-binding chemotaxis protein CheW
MVETTRSLTTFYVEGWRFGLPSSEIREVIQSPRLTFVPLLSAEVRGVFNVRGEIVTVIDLRRRLGLPTPAREPTVHMILETAEGTVSLLVDRPGDVLDIESCSFETPPTRLSEHAQDCVIGAYKSEQELVLLLDSHAVLFPSGQSEATPLAPARADTQESSS